MTRDLLAYAIAAARRGWHVFPLNPDDKTPLTWREPSGEHRGWQWTRHATNDHNTVARFWIRHPACNIGIACGPSGLLAVDLDTPKSGDGQPPADWDMPGVGDGVDVLATLCDRAGQPFPVDTFTVRTGRGGLHLYFTAPEGARLGNSAGSLGWLVDTRGDGGYVVGPGSIVAGNVYTVVNDAAPAPLPFWLADRLAEPHEPVRDVSAAPDPVHAPAGYAGAALRGEVAAVLAAHEGQRNITLYAAARRLGELIGADLLPDHLVTAALQQAAATVGLGAREIDATIRSGVRTGITQPRRGVVA